MSDKGSASIMGVRLFEKLGEPAINLKLAETFGGPKASHLRYRLRPGEAAR